MVEKSRVLAEEVAFVQKRPPRSAAATGAWTFVVAEGATLLLQDVREKQEAGLKPGLYLGFA
jgi:hypothetical protein